MDITFIDETEQVSEEKIQEIAQEGLVWTNPQWKNYDGTIAEW